MGVMAQISLPDEAGALPVTDGPLDDWRRQLGALPPPAPARWLASFPRRRTSVTAAIVLALVAAVGTASVGLPLRSRRPDPPSERVNPGPTATLRAPTATVAASTSLQKAVKAVASRPDCAPTRGVLDADVDQDGCGDALTFVGGVLTAGDAEWSVGQPGDQVAVGDWSCRGLRTLALFRPSTGDVFRLDEWAETDRPITATALARIEMGVAIRAADLDHDGCHELVVDVRDGEPEVVSGIEQR